MRPDIRRYVRPYRPGMGPVFRFDLTAENDGYAVQVHVVPSLCNPCPRTCVFNANRYRPGLSARDNVRLMLADVVSFACAYVDRPEEFDRHLEDAEQMEREVWLRHGDALSAMLDSDY